MRIGYGYDTHRFADARRLVLGGVVFPGERGLLGHSDADVLIHAIIDAVLGAAAMGDIGTHFPDNAEEWKDADSAVLLRKVVEMVDAAGYEIGNVDCTVICERPKIMPKVAMIRERLSSIMGVEIGDISVKGKTNEQMDDVGSGKGIEVHAVCLIKEKDGGGK